MSKLRKWYWNLVEVKGGAKPPTMYRTPPQQGITRLHLQVVPLLRDPGINEIIRTSGLITQEEKNEVRF